MATANDEEARRMAKRQSQLARGLGQSIRQGTTMGSSLNNIPYSGIYHGPTGTPNNSSEVALSAGFTRRQIENLSEVLEIVDTSPINSGQQGLYEIIVEMHGRPAGRTPKQMSDYQEGYDKGFEDGQKK